MSDDAWRKAEQALPPLQERLDRLERQSAEFDALALLVACYRSMPAVVDDDFPEWRDQYELLLRRFMRALRENRGAFELWLMR